MRKTHPTLFILYVIYTVALLALGFNFIFLTPAFMPLSIDNTKWAIGLVFLGCGFLDLVLLLVNSYLTPRYEDTMRPLLRFSMALSAITYGFWAVATTFDFFDRSQTSMQLPIYCALAAAFGFVLLTVPFTNPAESGIISLDVVKPTTEKHEP